MTGLRPERTRRSLTAPVKSLRAAAARWLHPSSALIVPVPEAEAAVASWARQNRVDFDGAPLHVTIMFPFLPAPQLSTQVEDAVRELATRTTPFSFALKRVGQFPGVHFLAPGPAEPFVAMTKSVQAQWPQCEPYGGAFDEIRPHMTVAVGDSPPADLHLLEGQLPIESTATELWLIEQKASGWHTRRRFSLGVKDSRSA